MKRKAEELFNAAFVEDKDRGYHVPRDTEEAEDEAIKRGIQEIADAVGITLSTRDAISGWFGRDEDEDATYCWNGEDVAMGRRNNSDIVHDIAHHQCSAPSRRHLPEWGLGTSPDGTKEAKLAVGHEIAQREEECASLLGILWERKIGMPWTHTMDDHNWGDFDSNLVRALRKLRRWNLIDENLNPLPNMRPANTRV